MVFTFSNPPTMGLVIRGIYSKYLLGFHATFMARSDVMSDYVDIAFPMFRPHLLTETGPTIP